MVSHLCLFSIHVHAVPNADYAWALAGMKAAAGLQFVINVHAVPNADHTQALADKKGCWFAVHPSMCMLSQTLTTHGPWLVRRAVAGLQFVINVHAVLYADHAWAPADLKIAAGSQFISYKLLFPRLQ